MNDSETAKDYYSRVDEVVNQLRMRLIAVV